MNRNKVQATVVLFLSLAILRCTQLPAQDVNPVTQEQPIKPREVAPPREPEVNPPRDQEVKPPKEQPEGPAHKTEKQEIPPAQQGQQKPAHEQHGTSKQSNRAKPVGKSARIPDPQFKANFGKQHQFVVNRIITTTTIIPNQTQFIV